jgi:excisionase family DNA binding protein
MLTPRLLRLALFCADQELKARQRKPLPPKPQVQGWESELVRALELEVATSASGSGTGCMPGQSEAKAPISTRQAAEILRCTTRYIRDIAEDRLDGVKVGSRWVFDEDVVRDYKERQRNARLAG